MFHTRNYRELTKLFFMFVLPALSSQLLSGIYTIVDGYFVGWGMGQDGLAAIGLAFPFSVIVTAIGAGIGVGGGALIAISMGRRREALAQRILGAMVFLMIAASALSSLLLTPLAEYLLTFYDVSPEIAGMARLYAWILIISSPAQVVTMAMLGAVRNDGFPRKAMFIMIAAFGTNIVLDWLWVIVFPFGIAGAAWATVASQAVSAVLLSAHFLLGMSKVRLRARLVRPWRPLVRRIFVMGASPFGVQIATAVTMILYNWQSLAYGGDIGVAAYAVVGYIVPVGVMLEEGIAEGIQPLISYYHGASLGARRRLTARLGFTTAVSVGAACSLLVFFSNRLVPAFFSMHGEAAEVAARGLLLSVPVFPFLGLAKVGASYYQAVGRSDMASMLTYGDPFILQPLFLWTLPLLFSLDGVWLAMFFTNMTLAMIFVIMWRRGNARRIPLSGGSIIGFL
ncbi:MATE family efflux transporter [Cloacibacillus evryensis]|uniref:MATE family efflux transporter n=1 Tax=Cloacibacillus evryensis TaxID=508460 RepID=UPI000240E00B|nr:MATE family efflux transporter [Cloacibacillus evryensis]EHL64097.1 MATE efflux family protein [Synergistes sp. 3_1_syn1]MEA5036005.1 MATE family efflux transporter [Cloacibacillus evryensis]